MNQDSKAPRERKDNSMRLRSLLLRRWKRGVRRASPTKGNSSVEKVEHELKEGRWPFEQEVRWVAVGQDLRSGSYCSQVLRRNLEKETNGFNQRTVRTKTYTGYAKAETRRQGRVGQGERNMRSYEKGSQGSNVTCKMPEIARWGDTGVCFTVTVTLSITEGYINCTDAVTIAPIHRMYGSRRGWLGLIKHVRRTHSK